MTDSNLDILQQAPLPQENSLLFSISAKIRALIFQLVLADYPDPSPDKQYQPSTIYARPSYFAPRKSDTELLRTCRAVYEETWFLPFLLKEQSHWIGEQSRAPPEYDVKKGPWRMKHELKQIVARQGEVEINSLRIFPQMFELEGNGVPRLLRVLKELRFRCLTITIRHGDWWYWERDEPLHIEGSWIENLASCLPESVREVHMELESLERKKVQVNRIAQKMCERWFFKRRDDVALFADASGKSNEVTRWRGDSSWHEQRWVRDETEPGKIDYYMVGVAFRLKRAILEMGGTISEEARDAADKRVFDSNRMYLNDPEAVQMPWTDPVAY